MKKVLLALVGLMIAGLAMSASQVSLIDEKSDRSIWGPDQGTKLETLLRSDLHLLGWNVVKTNVGKFLVSKPNEKAKKYRSGKAKYCMLVKEMAIPQSKRYEYYIAIKDTIGGVNVLNLEGDGSKAEISKRFMAAFKR